ncbi:MAG: DUF3347 domain-containing protein [Bacteroidota bacterium]
MFRLVLAFGLMAGCAAPPALTDGASTPASPEASRTVSLAPLAPVQAPALPAALRPSGATVTTTAAPGHGAHGHLAHSARGHDAHADPDTPLARALGAYIAIGDALAADDDSGAPDLARVFTDAWAEAVDTAPEADPHFWPMRNAEVQAVADAARALQSSADLDATREAYAILSAPLASLVEAHGAPLPLQRFTCGMRSDLPENGVWLQPSADSPRNPYFGSQMLACATPGPALSGRADDLAPEASGEMNHRHSDHGH